MRLRLLPILIATAAVTLTVRLGDLWQGDEAAGSAVAEEIPADLPAELIESAIVPQAGGAADPEAESGDRQAMAEEDMAGDSERSGLATDPFSLTDTEIELLQRLGERRAEIERDAAAVEERRLLLEAAESRVDQKLDELKGLQAMIQDLLERYDEKEEEQLQSLVKIYESMKPKDAARIFEELDMPVLLEVIGRMKERKTAPVLAMMDPEKAKAVTLELATRQSLPVPRR